LDQHLAGPAAPPQAARESIVHARLWPASPAGCSSTIDQGETHAAQGHHHACDKLVANRRLMVLRGA